MENMVRFGKRINSQPLTEEGEKILRKDSNMAAREKIFQNIAILKFNELGLVTKQEMQNILIAKEPRKALQNIADINNDEFELVYRSFLLTVGLC